MHIRRWLLPNRVRTGHPLPAFRTHAGDISRQIVPAFHARAASDEASALSQEGDQEHQGSYCKSTGEPVQGNPQINPRPGDPEIENPIARLNAITKYGVRLPFQSPITSKSMLDYHWPANPPTPVVAEMDITQRAEKGQRECHDAAQRKEPGQSAVPSEWGGRAAHGKL